MNENTKLLSTQENRNMTETFGTMPVVQMGANLYSLCVLTVPQEGIHFLL